MKCKFGKTAKFSKNNQFIYVIKFPIFWMLNLKKLTKFWKKSPINWNHKIWKNCHWIRVIFYNVHYKLFKKIINMDWMERKSQLCFSFEKCRNFGNSITKQWNLPTTLFNEKTLLQCFKKKIGIWKQDMFIFIKNTKYSIKFQFSSNAKRDMNHN